MKGSCFKYPYSAFDFMVKEAADSPANFSRLIAGFFNHHCFQEYLMDISLKKFQLCCFCWIWTLTEMLSNVIIDLLLSVLKFEFADVSGAGKCFL